jgi:hypothetical protein
MRMVRVPVMAGRIGLPCREARRRQHGGREAVACDARRQRVAAHQRRAGFAHRGRGLDPVAALRGDPEEGGRLRVPAADQVAVGHERAQAGPGARGTADAERGHRLDPVDRQRDVEFFGLHVVRVHRVHVGGRAEEHAGIGLDVPVFRDAGRHRPRGRGRVRRRGEDEGGTALGLQADARGTGDGTDRIRPGTRGVDHDRRLARLPARFDRPDRPVPPQCADLRVVHDLAAMRAHAAQEALVDGMHVHVGSIRFVDGAQHAIGAQHRREFERLRRVEQAATRRDRPQDVPVALQLRFLPVGGDHHRAARADQRVLAEPRGRALEERAARHGECAHLRRAVAFHEERGGAARGVVARLRLPLQQQHAAVRREEVADGRAGDAGTHHEKVGIEGHGARC